MVAAARLSPSGEPVMQDAQGRPKRPLQARLCCKARSLSVMRPGREFLLTSRYGLRHLLIGTNTCNAYAGSAVRPTGVAVKESQRLRFARGAVSSTSSLLRLAIWPCTSGGARA